jgi:hypothetical protein
MLIVTVPTRGVTMRVPARAAAVFAAFVTPALAAAAQAPPAEVFGRVVNDAGAGIPGVFLRLDGTAADGEQVDQQALSGPDGWWKFGALPVGSLLPHRGAARGIP